MKFCTRVRLNVRSLSKLFLSFFLDFFDRSIYFSKMTRLIYRWKFIDAKNYSHPSPVRDSFNFYPFSFVISTRTHVFTYSCRRQTCPTAYYIYSNRIVSPVDHFFPLPHREIRRFDENILYFYNSTRKRDNKNFGSIDLFLFLSLKKKGKIFR